MTMNKQHQPYLDTDIISWKLTNTTNIPVYVPDGIKPINNPDITRLQPTVNEIVSSRTRYTDKFYTYLRDTIIGQSIRLYGEYTQVELDLLKQFSNNQSIIYDIGANIGYHTLGFSHMSKHVYAFEPNTKSYKLLEMNTKNRKNITLFKKIVGDSVGKNYISDYDTDSQGNYGECMVSNTGELVDQISIDSLTLPKPDIIKIDVEGFEINVFNGAKQTIKKHTPIMFYESHNCKELDQIYDFLHDECGYEIYWIPSPNFNPNNFKKNQENVFGYGGVVNCLALPKRLNPAHNSQTVIDRNDTHMKFYDRMSKVNK